MVLYPLMVDGVFAEITVLQRQIQDLFDAKDGLEQLHGPVTASKHPTHSVPFLNVISSAKSGVGP